MTATATIDARTLAWEADRLAWADLTDQQREWFEKLAVFYERELAELRAAAEDAASDAAEESTDRADAELELRAAYEAIGLETNPEDGLDEIKAAIEGRLRLEREEGKLDALVPSRTDAKTKAKRLLLEARLDVTRYDIAGPHKGLIVAECRGDSGKTYELGFDPHRKQWRCTCPELKGNCSHLHALKLVTTTRES